MCGFSNVWLCVGVVSVLCGSGYVWVCMCVFVMFGCLYVWVL